MPVLVKIPLPAYGITHHRFEWNTGGYKKLIGFFCSPDVFLSLVFNDGQKVFLRQSYFGRATTTPPNDRILYVDKELSHEMIVGVVSHRYPKEEGKSIYFIVER